jgi:hypothetical protein
VIPYRQRAVPCVSVDVETDFTLKSGKKLIQTYEWYYLEQR